MAITWHTQATAGYPKETAEAHDNAIAIASLLESLGWSLPSACALIGNAQGESGLNPWRWESDYVPTVAEAYAWTPAQLSVHGYGLFSFTYFTKYVDYAMGYPGYGPNFADRTGSNLDGQAQVLFMNDEIPNDWTHNQYGYYADDFSAIGVDISTFYYMTPQQFMAGTGYTLEQLVGAFELCYERPADWAAANSYPFRVQTAQYWYDELSQIVIPPYPSLVKTFNIMFYLKPKWKRWLGL